MKRSWFVLCFLLAAGCAALAQDAPGQPVGMDGAKSIERLQTLLPALEAAEKDLEALREKFAAATTEADKADAAEAISAQRESVAQLRANFLTIATGVEESRYLLSSDEIASWEDNLEDIIAPISRSVREMTAGARETEQLRNELKEWEERKALAENASARLHSLLALAQTAAIRDKLEEAGKAWSNRLAEATSQTEVLRQKMEERERESLSTWEAVSEFIAEFWRTRGLNLLLALSLSVVVFVATRRS
jgi:hypothetical protein